MPKCPADLDYTRAGPITLAVGVCGLGGGKGRLFVYFSSFLFFCPFSRRRETIRYRLKYCLKGL